MTQLEIEQLLQRARTLLGQVQEDIRINRFGTDDIRMKMYNGLVETAANLFPEDSILNGQIERMPDAHIQRANSIFGAGYLVKFPQVASERIGAHLINLIDRLELLIGAQPTQQSLDERDFIFIVDQNLREVLRLDFFEAQKAFIAQAYKACGLLCGGLIEGMLLDIVQKPAVVTQQQFDEIANRLHLPRSGQSIDWDKVSMTSLIKMSGELVLVSKPVLKFAEGARDIRDTIHPRAEVRQGHRVLRDEADILLQLVKLIYNDLVAEFSKG